LTLKECIENNKPAEVDKVEVETVEAETIEAGTENAEDKKEQVTIYYVTDEQQQSQYINMFKAEGMDAVILTHNIDSPFISQLEQRNENVKFERIDADLTDTFKQDVAADEEEAFKANVDILTEIFRKALENDKLDVKVEKLKNENVASMMTLSEESRRMQDMMKMYGMMGMDPSMFGSDATLVLNVNHPLVQYVLNNKEGEHTALFCKQLYDLALLGNKPLNPEEMTAFINRSNEIMMLLTK
jgi:molecular chaperone HtpG